MASTNVLTQLLLVFFITIVMIAAFRRLKFPPIIGYIVVGLIIGVLGHRSFRHLEGLSVLAKYGVVFLLFTIGLEFSLSHLIAMRKNVFGVGSLQMAICGVIGYLLCIAFKLPPSTAFVVSVSMAMSSTAITSKILTEKGDLSTNVGHLTMSILIFQDLLVVPAIIITGFFAQSGDNIVSSLSFDLIKGVFTFAILIVVGKKIVTPIFNEVARARSSELFTLTTLFIALGAAYFSELMGMSKEFGAFLAGAIIAGTPYHHQVESDIKPFRDVLLGLFFIGIGTMLNLQDLLHYFWIILSIALTVVIGKFFVVSLLVKGLKLGNNKEAVKMGLFLSQGGEFGFVLIGLASHYNFFGNVQSQILLAALIMSMVISMIFLRFHKTIAPFICRTLFFEKNYRPDHTKASNIKKGTIIIAGYSRVGQWIGRALTSQGHEYLALDLDPSLVNQATLAGENVIYADASDAKMLRHLHIADAAAIVLTFQDPNISMKVLAQIRLMSKTLPIVVRTKNDEDIEQLTDAGATQVISDALEASLMLSLHLLVSLGMDLKAAIEWSEHLRQDRHGLLRGYFLGEEQAFDGASPQSYLQRAIVIEPGHAADGQTLGTLNPGGYNVEILAIRKNGILAPYPSSQARVHVGDVLVISGLPENLDRFEWYLIEGT